MFHRVLSLPIKFLRLPMEARCRQKHIVLSMRLLSLYVLNWSYTLNHLFVIYMLLSVSLPLLSGQRGTSAFHDISIHWLPFRDSKGGRCIKHTPIFMCFAASLCDRTRWSSCICCAYALIKLNFLFTRLFKSTIQVGVRPVCCLVQPPVVWNTSFILFSVPQCAISV
jgi:hypothetical protein